ncbi:MAG: L,D-transpeptidase [Planctomycetota bacterium]
MRGLVVVALGAILIWLGLGVGGRSDAAGPEETEDPRSTPQADGEHALGGIRGRSTSVDELPPPPAESFAAAPDPDPAVAYVEEQVYEPAPTHEVANDVAPPELTFSAPAAEVTRSAVDDDLAFGAGSRDSTRLGSLLLEAWIAEDASELETYILQGEGAELPDDCRQLVVGFWDALAGDVETARTRYGLVQGGQGVTSAQLALLGAALEEPTKRAVPRSASSGRVEPIALAMEMVLLEDEARGLLDARDYGRSAVAWSDLVQLELEAPWEPHRAALLEWGFLLAQAQDNHRFAKGGSWPSVEEKVRSGDSLTAIRKRVIGRNRELVICTGLIEAANGLGRYLRAGDVLRIPTDRVNVVVDLDARVLLYRHGSEVVRVYQIGIGKAGHETPLGVFTIGDKLVRPAHSVKGLPYGHPDNPLGSRWLALLRDGQKTSYGIHGTSDPDGVGGAVSLGCVRMSNGDVDGLFEILPMGSEVIIQR